MLVLVDAAAAAGLSDHQPIVEQLLDTGQGLRGPLKGPGVRSGNGAMTWDVEAHPPTVVEHPPVGSAVDRHLVTEGFDPGLCMTKDCQ